MTPSITDAVVIKDQNLFLLTAPDGRVPMEDGHGLGLYLDDCRFLRGYELAIAGRPPNALAATAGRGYMAVFQLSGPEIELPDGGQVPREEMGITWERVADGTTPALHDRLTFENFGAGRIEIPVTLTFRAAFEDVFAIRDLLPGPRGVVEPPAWEGDTLLFRYRGADDLTRSLSVAFSRPPASTDGAAAHFSIAIEPRERAHLLLSLTPAVATDPNAAPLQPRHQPGIEQTDTALRRRSDSRRQHETLVHSDCLLLNRVMDRSFRDLSMLRSRIGGEEFYAAGVPWYATLFGRDSLLTALQTLAYDSAIAADTLRLLARHQGTVVDDWRDEQPGKILHELRTGEAARAGAIPHTPYYGTVDATPLFLILLARYAAWTGDLALFHELRDAVERALAWMADYGDQDGDGYLDYQRRSPQGLENQGWKDSHDAIVNADGSLATPPIALVEAQGYAYLAKVGVAELFERTGDRDRAAGLRRQAADLRTRFNRDFWLDDKGCYALARQAEGRPAAVVSSNAGHALWTGIAAREKARLTADRLMAEDMFSGWGIRTLSAQERRYNPNGYHVGSVWPHDNALILAGFRRYGCDAAARQVFTAMLEAAMDFEQYQLPELFAGFPRAEYGIPVRYPVACRPQAWAAGTFPSMLDSMLGLTPEAFAQRLRVVRPLLPDSASSIELHNLRVGDASVALRFERNDDGVTVRVLSIHGPLEVLVEGAGVRI